MSELLTVPSTDETSAIKTDSTRRIVAYFDHEFSEPSLDNVERDVDE